MVVSLRGTFSIPQFTTDDVSRITARAHVDQTGRVALEKIMLQLHSRVSRVNVNPILLEKHWNDASNLSAKPAH